MRPLVPGHPPTGTVIGYESSASEGSEAFISGGRRGIGIYSLPPAPATLLVCRSLSEILRAIPAIDRAQGLGFLSIGGETPSPDARINLTKFEKYGYALKYVTEFSLDAVASATPEIDQADDPDEPGFIPG